MKNRVEILIRKYLLVFLINIVALASFSQIENSLDRKNIYDCETITQEIINDVADELKYKNYLVLDSLIDGWVSRCGVSEIIQRVLIIESILQKNNSSKLIEEYFDNGFQYKLEDRFTSSKEINFGFLYTRYKDYFGYVPLRHKLDSVLINASKELLRNNDLTSNEKLACTLFSGDKDAYKVELKNNKKGGTVYRMLNKKRRDFNGKWISKNLYAGSYTPFGSNKINTTAGTFGLTIGSPMRYKLIVEVGVKFRCSKSDETFKYLALGDTNDVKSESAIFAGGYIGYKIYDTDRLIVIPKLGVGLENLTTDLYTYKDEEKDYFEVKTVHLSLGVSMMIPIFKTSYLGLELNYHYNPYQLDKKVVSDLNKSAFSAELFFRF